jgi:NAD+ synthase (glutamine-hydrolysing)
MLLRSDGNYRELRHFAPWQRPREIEDYYLEQIVGKITGQYKVPFGDAVISTRDTCLGLETCEELFTPNGYVLAYTAVGASPLTFLNQVLIFRTAWLVNTIIYCC